MRLSTFSALRRDREQLRPGEALDGKDNPTTDVVDYDDDHYAASL